jgi:hypothetical protein
MELPIVNQGGRACIGGVLRDTANSLFFLVSCFIGTNDPNEA